MTLNYFLFFVKSFQFYKSVSGKLMMAILAASAVLTGCGGGSSSTINQAAVLTQISPTLSIANASVVEGSTLGTTNLQFTVTLSAASKVNISLTYSTSDGTALSTSDYTSIIGGQLTILAGNTTGIITVLVGADILPELDETLVMTLSNPINAKIATASATGTILNDDIFPLLSIANASVVEGSTLGTTNLQLTVTLTPAPTVNVSVTYSTSDGTALSASDYTATTASLNMLAGSTTATITILVNADKLPEANETLTLTLSKPINAKLAATASAIATILNDDAYGLNDTGITTWTDGTVNFSFATTPPTPVASNQRTVTQPTYPMQDADIGRDANVLLNSGVDGHAGFSFLKLDAQGAPLVNQAASYATTPWRCTLDSVTGLTWEVKTKQPTSLQNMNNTYTWYHSTGVNDGGNPGTSATVPACGTGGACDTEKYVTTLNIVGLCGFKDWRLPSKTELRSIIDYNHVGNAATGAYAVPLIDVGYFPNTAVGMYRSSSPSARSALKVWNVSFSDGMDNLSTKTNKHFIRLVRGVW